MNLDNYSEEQKLEINKFLRSIQYHTVSELKDNKIQQKTYCETTEINSLLFELGLYFNKKRQETKEDKYLIKNLIK